MSNAEEQIEQTEAKSSDKAQDDGDPPQNSEASKPEKKRGPRSVATLKNKIDIDPSSRIEKFDVGKIKAYKAAPRKGSAPIFALVCEPHLIPRHSKTEVYQSIINNNLANLVEYGVVYWPPTDREHYVLIYQSNWGKPLFPRGQPDALGLKQEVVLEKFLPSFIGIMQDFRDKDFVHGSIRPQNLFNTGGDGIGKIILGDCLSTPSGVQQPAAYETITRAMCDPIARGPGTQADDLYALGATVAALMRGTDPLAGMDPDAIVKHKIKVGSYAALTGKDRFTGSILELLRGLLNDEPSERWTIDEVISWMDGRRLSPKQTVKRVTAQRPLRFSGEKYFVPEVLAMDMEHNITEAKRIFEEDDLKNWIKRSLEIPELYERVELAVGQSMALGSGSAADDRLVANMSIALDPNAPIRFKGLRLHPDGIGSALAEVYALKQDLQPFATIFSQSIAMNWIRAQTNPMIDIANLIKRYDSCRTFVKQTKTGFGMERCLYLLNPEANCMSDKLKDYFVMTPEDYIYAIEDLCEKGKPPMPMMDRHIAAFLMVKDSKMIEPSMADINAEEYYKQLLGVVKCLGTIQRRSQLGAFPKTAQTLADHMNVIYKRYHDQKVRDAMKKNITTFAAEGNITKMSSLLSNADVASKDFKGFKLAMKEYHDLKMESEKLGRKLEDPKSFGIATGQEASAVIASLISAIIILAIGFMYLSDQAFF